MIWTQDYETIKNVRAYSSEKEKAQLDRALDYARSNLTYGFLKDEDDFIVITVEGYNCIAMITDEFNPIQICERVFPFDNERIYPMQEIEIAVNFKQYRRRIDY